MMRQLTIHSTAMVGLVLLLALPLAGQEAGP
jgi:hypothetical protein